MDRIINIKKRKKWKTRRCLDELRNKSRHKAYTSDACKETERNFDGFSSILPNKHKNRILISSKRLTLFPKAIKSEIITRPATAAKDSQSFHLLHDKSVTAVSSPLKSSLLCVNNECRCSHTQVNSKLRNNFKINSCDENFNFRSSPESFSLFSSIDQTHVNTLVETQNEGLSSVMHLPPSSFSPYEDYRYQLYEEFIDQIPPYLSRKLPDLFKEDIMSDTKSYLQKLFMKECLFKCRPVISQCYNKAILDHDMNTNYKIVHNPTDYIRLGCTACHGTPLHNSNNSSASCNSDSVNSPSFLHSSSSPTVHSTQSVIHITPEYNFYPHKLN